MPACPDSALLALDDALCGGRAGVLVVRCAEGLAVHVAAHAKRRAVALGRMFRAAGGLLHFDGMRDLACACGASDRLDPIEAGAALAAPLAGSVAVAFGSALTSWGTAVAVELGESLTSGELGGLVLFLTETRREVSPGPFETIAIGGAMTPLERRRFWDALDGERERMLGPLDLAALSTWWSGASGGDVAPAFGTAEVAADPDDPRADPWSLAIAAERATESGDADRAEALFARALASASSAELRADLWRRWNEASSRLPPDTSGERALRFAHRALDLGEPDRAIDLSRIAAGAMGETLRSLRTLGRASAARGELSAALSAFERAHSLADGAAVRARIEVDIADVRFAEGQFVEAERCARSVLAGEAEPSTRMDASNLVGKAHLGRAAWDEAERHFADDARDAVCAGDTRAELRARLNGAIARMGAGKRDEARAMLVTVLEDGQAAGDASAMYFALTNLATNAAWEDSLGEAIAFSQRAVAVAAQLTCRERAVMAYVGLGASHIKAGAFDEAEKAIRRAKQVGGAIRTGRSVSYAAALATKVHLARGDLRQAKGELRAAVAAISKAAPGDEMGLCHRLAAAIALEEGDVAQAEAAIARAREVSWRDDTRAECALLEVKRARAAGEPFEALAEEALAVAQAHDFRLLAIEARALLGWAALARQAHRAASSHSRAAAALTEQLAATLPPEARAAFRAKPELLEARRLRAALSGADDEAAPLAQRKERGGAAWLGASAIDRMVGAHPSMRALARTIERVGASDVAVLVQGESGTGKELVAEALHEASPRQKGPLVKVHCAALVETLLLSELFGHEKGAFTGAAARAIGRFERADGGTIFLDEIGDISPRTQVALLRVLQDGTFERVGGTRPIRTSCRVICASHRDLAALVDSGEMRQDLYFRLAGMIVNVPPLRARIDDLPAIADAILARIASERGGRPKVLSPEAIEGLSRHTWPGNVRELENAVRAAALFATSDAIDLEDFTGHVPTLAGLALGAAASAAAHEPSPAAPRGPVDTAYAEVLRGTSLADLKRAIERTCIEQALSESGGNITRASLQLGMKRARLSQLVKELGLLPSRGRTTQS